MDIAAMMTPVRAAGKAVLQLALALGIGILMATPVAAQDGTLRGTVSDDTGAALPGVTVTTTSPALIGARETVTDSAGQYRLGNLPPGTYVLTAQLPGFAIARRENIVMRAGATFQADVALAIGSLSETVNVSGDSPMVETELPINVLNVRGDLQRSLPLLEGKNWVDVLEVTPGVFGRTATTAQRVLYFAAAADQNDNVAEFEGLNAATVSDTTINRISLTPEAIDDTQIKTGGLDAASAMGKGVNMRVTFKSGGNAFSGSAGQTFTPYKWNHNNQKTGAPEQRKVHQYDFSLGGPIVRDRAWFFAAGRYQNNRVLQGRPETEVQVLKALFPDQEAEDSTITGIQPVAKVTARLGGNHTLMGMGQFDRLHEFIVTSETLRRYVVTSMGGGLYGGSLTSVWGQKVTTTFTVGYNNKGGNNLSSYNGRLRAEPRISFYQTAQAQGGRLVGSGVLGTDGGTAALGCTSCQLIDGGTMLQLRGDLTWYKGGWGGSHDFKVGFLALPNVHLERTLIHNDPIISESRRLVNPNNLSAGTVAFHRNLITSPLEQPDMLSRTTNVGVYVQDVWRPIPRLTATLGVRADYVHRLDRLQNFVMQSSTQLAPRVGASYLLTRDARNVVRGSFSRMFENLQVGRNPMTTHGAERVSSFQDVYDLNSDGIFETVFNDPAVSSGLAPLLYADDLRQPGIDELIVGYRGQFPGQMSLDVSHVRRSVRDRYARVDINGFYPDGPFKPFGGFGRIDPNLGSVYEIRNWDGETLEYRAMQIVVTKEMTHGFQVLLSIHKQWQHNSGTWHPTDPARFIQPDAYPNDGTLQRTREADTTSYTGGSGSSMWAPGSMRAGLVWEAPLGVQVASTYTIAQLHKAGPVQDRLAADHPDVLQFGPATVVSSTGARFSNPLATRTRFAYATRGENQPTLPAVHNVSLKLSRKVNLTDSGEHLDLGFTILNMLNGGRAQYWASNSHQLFSPLTFAQGGPPQRARAFQLEVTYRF
jgi:hypothetical protein